MRSTEQFAHGFLLCNVAANLFSSAAFYTILFEQRTKDAGSFSWSNKGGLKINFHLSTVYNLIGFRSEGTLKIHKR